MTETQKQHLEPPDQSKWNDIGTRQSSCCWNWPLGGWVFGPDGCRQCSHSWFCNQPPGGWVYQMTEALFIYTCWNISTQISTLKFTLKFFITNFNVIFRVEFLNRNFNVEICVTISIHHVWRVALYIWCPYEFTNLPIAFDVSYLFKVAWKFIKLSKAAILRLCV